MASAATARNGSARRAEPAWEIARIFPNQGYWDEVDYLALTDSTNHLVEYCDGKVEVLPMPTLTHQRIVRFLFQALLAFVSARGLGEVLFAAFRVKVRKGQYREPDVMFMANEHADRMGEKYAEGADLVMEVVSGSPEDRERDLVTKRREYAKAGIPEYWLVDPEERRITILKLSGKSKSYTVHGRFGPADRAASALLKGFSVDVSTVLNAGKGRK